MTYQRAIEILQQNQFKVSVLMDANGDGTYTTTGIEVYAPSTLSKMYIDKIDRLLWYGFKIQSLPNKDSLLITKKNFPKQPPPSEPEDNIE